MSLQIKKIHTRYSNNGIMEYIYYKNTGKYFANRKYDMITVYSELLRCNIIRELIHLFVIEIRKLKLPRSHKFCSYNNIADLVQRWCWFQYYNKTCMDHVIPYVSDENYDYNMFIENLNYGNANIETHITYEFIEPLRIEISKYLKKSYKTYDKQINIKLLVPIKKKIHGQIVNLKVVKPVNIKLKYIQLEETISIHISTYNRLIKKLKMFSNIDNYDIYIYCLMYRYSYLDANNQQLAVNVKIKELLRKYGVNFELFGSAINSVSDYYCSLFYDIEWYFGSQGNVFDLDIKSGIYWCNPPYVNEIMEDVVRKILNIIKNNNNVAFIFTIPMWDKCTQDKNIEGLIKNYNTDVSDDNFTDYGAYYLLKKHIKYELILSKTSIPFFNFKTHRPICPSGTYMLYVHNSNNPIINNLSTAFDKIIEMYKRDEFA